MRGIICDKCKKTVPYDPKKSWDEQGFMTIRINIHEYETKDQGSFDLCNEHKLELYEYLGGEVKDGN